jgi:tellurite resistance protein/uncharacterized protein (DUF697 family)
MTTIERESIAALCLMAAFVDGVQTDQERERLRQTLEQIGNVDDSVFQRVVMHRTTMEDEARRINEPASKQLAYDLAVAVAAADGTTSRTERDFLAKLASALGIPDAVAQEAVRTGDEMAEIRLDDSASASASSRADFARSVTAGAAGAAGTTALAPSAGGKTLESQVDDTIMTHAAICAGVELLPQRLAGIAVVPLQTKLVYKIGSMYGYKLDSGHIKEFIAAAGLGVTSQVLESYARRFLGTLAGKYLGKTAKTVIEKASGPVMSFASTYAIGQVAKAYYSGGRKLSMNELQRLFTTKVEEAKGIYARNQGSITETARKLDPRQIITMLRGA